jgi:pyruvate/2-oxoglutarate dehydrogenase complex dihydrolipoamide acyltransferase (E2) component
MPCRGSNYRRIDRQAFLTPAPSASPATAFPRPGRDPNLGFISPVVARLAREENIDLQQVKGSGQGGRITKNQMGVRQLIQQERQLPFLQSGEPQPAMHHHRLRSLYCPVKCCH